MRNLFRFFVRFHTIVIFLILEIATFSSVVTHHKNGGRFLHSAYQITGVIYGQISELISYYRLKEINKELNIQNASLANQAISAYRIDTAYFRSTSDSIFRQQYQYIATNVIKNSTDKPRNFITLDKGKAQGMEPDMALISASGAVGVVVAVSQDFSLAISLLNKDFNLSGMIKRDHHIGTIRWVEDDPTYVVMEGVPGHATLMKGDTIVTSGYSAIFPTNVPIGIIDEYRLKDGRNFYDIKIKLLADFTSLGPVLATKNLLKQQQLELEEANQ